MRKRAVTRSEKFYSFIDFAEDFGEIVLLPMIFISVSSFYKAIIYSKNEIEFLLDALLLVIVLVALTCIILKRISKLHIIWVREIPNLLIFWFVFGCYFVIEILQKSLTSQLIEPINQILFGLAAGVISLSFLLFQTKPWLKISYRLRNERVAFLIRKAKLKNDEWDALRYKIIDTAKEKNKPSWIWRMVEALFVIALASLIDAYSGQIADIIQKLMP